MPSDEIRALIDQGKPAEAYRVGTTLARDSNDLLFDYYLGMAAIDAGAVPDGVTTLKRYVEQNPTDPRARLELGRGYYLLADNASARTEFEAVRSTHPPPQVTANIDLFLNAIQEREAQASGVGLTGYVEGGLGYDSNINGGVNAATINLPTFGNVVIDNAGVRTGASYARVAAGVQAVVPLGGGISTFAALNDDRRRHSRSSQFDMNTTDANGGLAYAHGADTVRGSLLWNNVDVGHNRFRTMSGYGADWQHVLNSSRLLFLSAQTGEFRYAGFNSVRNSSFDGFAGGVRQAWDASWRPALVVSANTGRERNRNQRDDLSNERNGLRVAVDLKPAAEWAVTAGFNYQSTRHLQADAILATVRKDDYYALDAAVTYALSRNVSVRGALAVADNRSNLALYAFKRNTLGVSLRYDFR
ncbi:MAG: hypothetical protein A3H93_15515 [Rhodocyclales bacterium RIFCSPLOWO2_02_FULL_63_24]|nr:MAG: hypothetical protein A3H93_15515 [Rhodocyclales bacterium RIFCSPLOWO2_02_FULL_63_24]